MVRQSRARLTDSVVAAVRSFHASSAHLDQVAAEHAGLAPSDLRCLNILGLHGGRLTAGDLARETGLTTGAVTGIIDRLVAAGLARRRTDTADRRRVIVELDHDAAAVGDALFEPLITAERRHLDSLSSPDLELLRGFLEAAARRAREQTAHLRASRGAGHGVRG